MVIAMTLVERLPYFGLAIVAFLIPTIGKEAALLLTLLFLGVQLAWRRIHWHRLADYDQQDHAASPARFIFSAFRRLVSIYLGRVAPCSPPLSWDRVEFPEGFALIFFIAGVSLLVSFVFLAMTYESRSAPKNVAEPVRWRQFGSRLRQILRQDENFRWFLIARGLTSLSVTAISFYTIYGIRRFDMTPEFAGALTSILLVSNTMSSSVIGWIGDRWGHRRVLIAANVLTVLAIAIALSAANVYWFFAVFALTGVVNSSQWTTIMTITVKFGSVAERPYYIGMANTLIAPVTVLAPIIGGWLVDAVSFELTFGIFAVARLLSILVYVILMEDPHELSGAAESQAMAAAD